MCNRLQRLRFVEFVVVIFFASSYCSPLSPITYPPDLQDDVEIASFSESNRAFSAAVYQKLAREQKGNFITCPLSVQTVMALASAGAKGDTSEEISRALKLPASSSRVQDIFRQVTPTLRGNEYYTLTSANKIYVNDNFQLNHDYQKVARDAFDAEVDTLDFGASEEAANAINDWVLKRTNGKIKQLVSADGLNEQTKLVLVNSLYFKGKWVFPFEEENTVEKPFHVSPMESQNVAMMQRTDFYDFYEDVELDAKFLRIPFMLNEVSMVFVLPNQIDGLAKLESRMDEVLGEHPYSNQQVRVQIPKFSMETSTQYIPILQELGIERAFTQNADLSGISANGKQLAINSVIQKTFINVTETGTEAAAATADYMYYWGWINLHYIDWNMDRPSIFYLQKKSATGSCVLFVGRICHPNST